MEFPQSLVGLHCSVASAAGSRLLLDEVRIELQRSAWTQWRLDLRSIHAERVPLLLTSCRVSAYAIVEAVVVIVVLIAASFV